MITFATMQFEHGNRNEKEFKVYKSLYNSILSMISPVDLFTYCKCPVDISIERIKIWNRIFGQDIGIDYLRELDTYYEKWISTLKKGRVETINTSVGIDARAIRNIILRRIKEDCF